jgi:DNA-binding beta-propeller fold protein YncE
MFLIDTTYSSTTGFGTTIAGLCNGSTSTNQTILNNPAGIIFGFNNTLYVADGSNTLLAFEPNNLTARVITSYPNKPIFPFIDNRTSKIFVTIFLANLTYIWPTNETIPPNGISYSDCSMNFLNSPTGIVVDSSGNVYVSSFYCHWVMKWAPNATNGTIVAGSTSGVFGSSSTSLYSPYGLALDEANSFLYVADLYNYRVQRFVLGSPNGATVAGGNSVGTAPNQLNQSTSIYVSKLDGSVYVCDDYNNRIQKWQQNATNGTTVAGSSNGTAGSTPYLLNNPYGIAIDDQENYMYVSDSSNNRVQRFSLH